MKFENSVFNRNKVEKNFYLEGDVVKVSKGLLGMVLCSCDGDDFTAGVIVETEAYRSYGDKASHACNGKRTLRNSKMFCEGGIAYVYVCYGMHCLFNVVTGNRGVPDAVLIRGLSPVWGIETMKIRRGGRRNLCSGPGVLTQALGISMKDNGGRLDGNRIWLECGVNVDDADVEISSRIGVEYAGKDSLLPWRFLYRKRYVG